MPAAGAGLKGESYKSEIAGYKLDRVFKRDLVPPTVNRSAFTMAATCSML